VRRPGGGRERIEPHHPEWAEALEKLMDPVARGERKSSIMWTLKSTNILSEELSRLDYNVSPSTIDKKLQEIGYSLPSNKEIISDSSYTDYNAQFEFINKCVTEQLSLNNPVISINTNKIEILENSINQDKQLKVKDHSAKVNDHKSFTKDLPRTLSYGKYDISKPAGYVEIETDQEISEFTANSIYGWWENFGNEIYYKASKILITADSGEKNDYIVKLSKYSVQDLADKIQMPIIICYFPPGINKWNKIKNKLFSFISFNLRQNPLFEYESIFNLISSKKTWAGPYLSCLFNCSSCQTVNNLVKEQISSINIVKNDFYGDWNYTILPHD
jgi:hypothetical protein